jgi:hypothetical protein
MKVLGKSWIPTSGGLIGVVLCENDYGQKAFIRVVEGSDEESDIQKVCDWGSTLQIEQAKGFFGSLVDDSKYGNY